jgi:hypothetical protein
MGGIELRDEARDVVATLPAARRAFDAQHIKLADQTADGSIAGHGTNIAGGPGEGTGFRDSCKSDLLSVGLNTRTKAWAPIRLAAETC